jgi:hypothetical protein
LLQTTKVLTLGNRDLSGLNLKAGEEAVADEEEEEGEEDAGEVGVNLLV